MLFVYSTLLKKELDFIEDPDAKEFAQNIAFGIGILFGAMSVVIGILAMVTACCKNKCCFTLVK